MTETTAMPPKRAAESLRTVAAPPLAPDRVPLCYVVDEDPSLRHFLSLILHGRGIDTIELNDGPALRQAASERAPDLVFQNISLDAAECIETLVALSEQGFRGAIQLMSNRGAAVLEHVKSVGTQHNLTMLPVLKKPFETEAVVNVLKMLNFGGLSTSPMRVNLEQAILNDWVEFWYQPKIDLRKKQLVGAEAYARVRHPMGGIALPGSFMPGASESSATKLAELALIGVLKAGAAFGHLGIHLRLSVNIQVPALVKLPIDDIVRVHRPSGDKWPGVIIDVPEEQILTDLGLARNLTRKLDKSKVNLAIDDFGRTPASLARLGDLPFAEVKLHAGLVSDCGTDTINAAQCKSVIDLAHNFGRIAVAMGIEKAADAAALATMGCDYGQGFLLGQPMPEERFISLLRQRAAASGNARPVQTI